MSTDLTRTLAEIAAPRSTDDVIAGCRVPKRDKPIRDESPPAEQPSLARRKAREIIDANPGATMTEVVALAYLEGRIEGVREMQQIQREVFNRPAEFDCICQRCGRRAGTRFAAPKDAPPHGYFEVVCFHCSSGDEPPRAA